MTKYAWITLLDGTKLYRSHMEFSQHVRWRYHVILYHFYAKMMGGGVTNKTIEFDINQLEGQNKWLGMSE